MMMLTHECGILGAILYVKYCETSNVNHTLIGNKVIDYSDVVGALPVGTAPTTYTVST